MKSNPFQKTNSHSPRQGVAIIVVIAFYAIAIALLGFWIRTALSHQRQARLRFEQVQTTWLADAGIRRAAAQLASDTNYSGERWQIEAAQLAGTHSAAVIIRIESIELPEQAKASDADPETRVRIVATAELPAGDKPHVRHTKSTVINLATIH